MKFVGLFLSILLFTCICICGTKAEKFYQQEYDSARRIESKFEGKNYQNSEYTSSNLLSYQDLFKYLVKLIDETQGKKYWATRGITGAGKSLWIHYMLGHPITCGLDEYKQYICSPDDLSVPPRVNFETLQSETMVTAVYGNYADNPGLFDNIQLDKARQILIAASNYIPFRDNPMNGIALVAEYGTFEAGRGNGLRLLIEDLQNLTPNFTDIQDSLLLVVTKAKDKSLEDLALLLKKLRVGLNNENSTPFLREFLDFFIKKGSSKIHFLEIENPDGRFEIEKKLQELKPYKPEEMNFNLDDLKEPLKEYYKDQINALTQSMNKIQSVKENLVSKIGTFKAQEKYVASLKEFLNINLNSKKEIKEKVNENEKILKEERKNHNIEIERLKTKIKTKEIDIDKLQKDTTVVYADTKEQWVICSRKVTSKKEDFVFNIRLGYPIANEYLYSEEGGCYVKQENRANGDLDIMCKGFSCAIDNNSRPGYPYKSPKMTFIFHSPRNQLPSTKERIALLKTDIEELNGRINELYVRINRVNEKISENERLIEKTGKELKEGLQQDTLEAEFELEKLQVSVSSLESEFKQQEDIVQGLVPDFKNFYELLKLMKLDSSQEFQFIPEMLNEYQAIE